MKIHCVQLVEGALRSTLDLEKAESKPATPKNVPTLLDNLSKSKESVVKLVFLDEGSK